MSTSGMDPTASPSTTPAAPAPRRPAAFRPYKKRAAELTAAAARDTSPQPDVPSAAVPTSVASSASLSPLDLRKRSSPDEIAPGHDEGVSESAAHLREAAEWYQKYTAAAYLLGTMPAAPPPDWDASWRQYSSLMALPQHLPPHLPLAALAAGAGAHPPVPDISRLQLPSPLLRAGIPNNNYEALCAAAAAQQLPPRHPFLPGIPLGANLPPASVAPSMSPGAAPVQMPSHNSSGGLKRRAMNSFDGMGAGRLKYSNFFSPSEKPKEEQATNSSAVTPGATSATSGGDSAELSLNGLNSKETDFLCSCGQNFSNLYRFTVHLRETGHRQRSAQREKDIPKLVRGQDMWINSETEQTREILRCISCKMSFRTLPDLTMHMIQTNHWNDIVYNDSGRCVYVNNNGQQQAKIPAPEEIAAKIAKKVPTLPIARSGSGKQVLPLPFSSRPTASPRTMTPRTEVTEADSASGEPEEAVMEIADEAPTLSSLSIQTQVVEPIARITPVGLTSGSTSGSGGSPPESPSSSEPPPVLQQIQSFVEKSLPAAPGRRPTSTMFRDVLSANELDPMSLGLVNAAAHRSASSTNVTGDAMSAMNQVYLAPENGSSARPDENPLSSLQKLVDTTDSRRRAAAAAAAAAAALTSDSSRGPSPNPRSPDLRDTPSPDAAGPVTSSSNTFPPSSPTVIMVNPTYIYQPAYPPPVQPPVGLPYYSPWVHALPLFGAGMGTLEPEKGADAVDLSSDARGSPAAPGTTSSGDTAMDTSTSSESATGTQLRLAWTDSNSAGGGSTGTLQKKAKCNFCGKPFANKGQVRLHISKGKCPNLLPRCRSPGSAPAHPSMLNGTPFSYMPLDYVSAAAAAAAASAAQAHSRSAALSPSTSTTTTTMAGGVANQFLLHQVAVMAAAQAQAATVSSSTGAAGTPTAAPTFNPLQVSPTASKKAEERLRMYCNLAKELSSNGKTPPSEKASA